MACDSHGGIAKDGSLPWPKCSDDFKLFKKYTTDNIVVMGSKTWYDPIFPKPLKNRTNVVVSSKHVEGADITVSSKDPYGNLQFIKEYMNKEVFIIGGAQLLSSMLDDIDTFYLSIFNETYDCDTFIPLDEIKKWNLVKEERYTDFTFKEFRR